MKTKTSKKVLSFILAVMMIVTSIPMLGIVAFADEVAATDPAVIEVQDAMDAFEAKLSSAGAFTNVTAAYAAYVDCQEAIDAYVYGGETNALDGKAAALTAAVANIGNFTGKTGTAVPSFANNSGNMTDYAGTVYNNVLYTSTVTESNKMEAANETGNVWHRIYYPETTLLYDGTNDAVMPVMGMASVSDKKNRYIYGSYPCVSASDYGDNANFNLIDYWHGNSGGNLDFTWSYYYTNDNPGYNQATGQVGNQSTSYRSQRLTYSTSWWGGFNSGDTKYIANGMKFVGTPADTYSNYTLTWYVSSGDTPNSDYTTIDASSTVIHVVNYKTLTDALAANGNKMKAVDMADFSEGGLWDYISAMEAAVNFDPNSYFTSSNDYTGCAQAIATLVSNMNNASVTNTNSADYEDLRTAMSDAIRNTYKAGNTGYTDDSWNTFAEKYLAAQTIMADVNDNGYTSATAAQAAVELVETYNNLQTNATKVDTTALANAIDTFEAYNQEYFTTNSYASVQAVVLAAKEAVWGSEDDYKIPTSAPDDSEEAQALVAEQTQAVLDAVKTLRLSADAVVAIDNGDRYSLNSAYALADAIEDTTAYSNYVTLSTAINNAKVYEATLATTDLTDLTAQLAEYQTYVNAIVEAYENLQYSFTRMPNGTVANATTSAITTLEDHKNSNGYNWWIDFSYPGEAIVFRTTHDAVTVNYGHTNTTFRINIDNNTSKENNALDSITINGTADANTEINSSSATSTPPALSDDQRASYAGCLANDGFSLTNFRVSDSMNNRKTYFGTTASGTSVSDRVPANDEYTTILATTEGTSTNPARGTIALQPSKSGDASITLTSDINVALSATSKRTLTASTTPSRTNYVYSGYFGATYVWNTQPTLAYAGYAYLTSKSNNELINSTVSVIDMSYLVDLVDQCNALAADSAKYTEQTWSNLVTALEAAQDDLNYTGMTADSIITNIQNRYSKLWAAYSALETKTFTVTFSYKNSAGADVTREITADYGDNLGMSKFNTQISSITTPDFVADNYTYTFKEWSPAVDYDTPITSNINYVAVYDGTPNEANWSAFNVAKQELLDMIQPETYSASVLKALDSEIEALGYFYYTTEQQATVMADHQDDIDAQTAKMVELKNGLTPADIDVSAAEAVVTDVDRYGATVEPYTTVTVAKISVIAYTYDDQDAFDAALREALTVMSYTIYLNDDEIATVSYGTQITVNSDGTYVEGEAADSTGGNAAWYYSFAAPSRDYVQTASKYMTTAPSLTFIVKGDTYLTATNVEDESAAGYLVKFVANLGGTATKTYGVAYTDESGVVENAPATPTYAHYRFTGYTCTGGTLGSSSSDLTVTGDCTVVANYEAITTVPTYTITYFDSYDDWGIPEATSEETYSYNDVVSLVDEDGNAEYWFGIKWGEDFEYEGFYLLSIGSEYTFRACQSFDLADEDTWDYCGIISMSESEVMDILEISFDSNDTFSRFFDGQGNEIKIEGDKYNKVYPTITPYATALEEVVPVYNASDELYKISMIGTYILPEGYTMVESGFLFTSDLTADLLIENVGTNGIARMKSSQHTEGDQFVISVLMSDTDYDYKYAAYAIVKDAEGNMSTYYSAAYTGSTATY